jgi:hypothetical protein
VKPARIDTTQIAEKISFIFELFMFITTKPTAISRENGTVLRQPTEVI